MGGSGPRHRADAGNGPWDPGGGQSAAGPETGPPAAPPPPLGAPPPWPAAAPPVTPEYSVGPQAWLAEDAPAAVVPPPPPLPRHAPPPPPIQRPTRELPAQAPQPWAGPPPGVPLVGPRRREWPVGLLVATAVALVLVVAGGFFVAGLFPTSTAGSATGGDPVAQSGGAPSEGGTDTAGTVSAPLQPVSVQATCQAPPSVDAAGNTVTYGPEQTLDAVGATAWRCAGSAVGQQLVYDFGSPVTLRSVALVPGYAKVDPADGTDRFLENRTVTDVVWRFDDGQPARQTIASPTATAAELELPGGVTTQRVVLEISGTGNDAAIRNFTAISDVRFVGR